MTDIKTPPVQEIPTLRTQGRSLPYVRMQSEANKLIAGVEQGVDMYQERQIRNGLAEAAQTASLSQSDMLSQAAAQGQNGDGEDGLAAREVSEIERVLNRLDRRSGQTSNTTQVELQYSAAVSKYLNKYPQHAEKISRIAAQSRNFGDYGMAFTQAATADAQFAAEKEAADKYVAGAIALNPSLQGLYLTDRAAFVDGAIEAYSASAYAQSRRQKTAMLQANNELTREVSLLNAKEFAGNQQGQIALVQSAQLLTVNSMLVSGNAATSQELFSKLKSGEASLFAMQNDMIASRADFINIYQGQIDPNRQMTSEEVEGFLAAPLAIFDNAIAMMDTGKFTELLENMKKLSSNPMILLKTEKGRQAYSTSLLMQDIKDLPNTLAAITGRDATSKAISDVFAAQASGVETTVGEPALDMYGELTAEPSSVFGEILRQTGGTEADVLKVLDQTIAVLMGRIERAAVAPVIDTGNGEDAKVKATHRANEVAAAEKGLVIALDETVAAQLRFLTRGAAPLPESHITRIVNVMQSPKFNIMWGKFTPTQKMKRSPLIAEFLGGELGNIKYNIDTTVVTALNKEIQGSGNLGTPVVDGMTGTVTFYGATEEAVDVLGTHVVWDVDNQNGMVTAILDPSFDMSQYEPSSQAKITEGLQAINQEYGLTLTSYARAYSHIANPYGGEVKSYGRGAVFLNTALNLSSFKGGE